MLPVALLLALAPVLGASEGTTPPEAKDRVAPAPSERAARITDWLTGELALDVGQSRAVRGLLVREFTSQRMAKLQGHAVEVTPPARPLHFVPEDAEPLRPEQLRQLRGAGAVLRAAAKRRRAEAWLAENAVYTELDVRLAGLRVTALDQIKRVLEPHQQEPYAEILGDQGHDWLRQLARQRTRRLPPMTAAQKREEAQARLIEQERAKQVAKEEAARKAAAKKKQQEEARRNRARGGGGRGRGARGGGRGRGRGRRR